MTIITGALRRLDADATGILLAAALGVSLVFAAGFAEGEVLHGAAHDQRHATGFPCH